MKEERINKCYTGVILISCIVKQLIVSCLPIFVRDAGGVDQWLMLDTAKKIASGSYGGVYHAGTLFKRSLSFPVFLALCHNLGIPYMAGYTLLYTIACLFFLYSISLLTKNRLIRIIAFDIILFAPSSYDNIMQMAYNLSFTAPLAILLISSLMIIYLKKMDTIKELVPFYCIAGVAITGIWLNREDSVWVIPLFFFFVITMILSYLKYRKEKRMISKVALVFLPLVFLVIGNYGYCYMNYKAYGVFVTNDYTDTNFEKAYNTILSVKPYAFPEHCSISHETLKRIYEVSPSMKELEPYIEARYLDNRENTYLTQGEAPYDGEIEDGWMNFVLREAAAEAGYYKSATISDNFWGKVDKEINEAFEKGLLEKRSMFFFGSTLHHPWVKGQNYITKWFNSALKILYADISHKYAYSAVQYNTTDDLVAKDYESFLFNYSVARPKHYMKASGWLVCLNYNKDYFLALRDEDDKCVQILDWMSSSDLTNAFDTIEDDMSEVRFQIFNEIDPQKNYYLCVISGNDVISEIPMTNNSIGMNFGVYCDNDMTGEIMYAFDSFSVEEQKDEYEDFAQKKVNLANMFGNLYRKLGMFIFAISCMVYIFFTVDIFRCKKITPEWLYMSAVMGCILILTVALAYIDAFMWGTVWYSDTITPLIDYFCALGIVSLFNFYYRIKNDKKGKVEASS